MLDACTEKIGTTQRTAILVGRNDFVRCGSRLYNGPLGASSGSDSGSAIHMSASKSHMPVADAVNDGARHGCQLLMKAGIKTTPSEHQTIVRVATFASKLWRTINGELGGLTNVLNDGFNTFPVTSAVDGVCAQDGYLRCSLLALWQRLWPKGCIAVVRVQSWKDKEGTALYKGLKADQVMKTTDEEQTATAGEDKLLTDLRKVVKNEINRHQWRGEMAAYRKYESRNDGTSSIGVNQPLDVIEKDNSWKFGGWVASASNQRRSKGDDGGFCVVPGTKVRLRIDKTA